MIFLIFQLLSFFIFLQYVDVNTKKIIKKDTNDHIDIKQPINEVKIIKTSKDIIGNYNSLPIYKFVATDSLEIFEFDGIFDGNFSSITEKCFIVNNLKYKFISSFNISDDIFTNSNK